MLIPESTSPYAGSRGVGIAALQNGTVQIAIPAGPEVLGVSRQFQGINPTPYAIANDGIAIVVHTSNPVQNLTIAQIKRIYTGQITNWNAVGGPNLPIVVISRDVASGTFEVFNEKALQGARVASTAQMLASNNAVVSTVALLPEELDTQAWAYQGMSEP
jgi:phosphate transport system substrate-binding protein